MKFETEIWSIKKLIDIYNSGNLNLNPPYQRNEIWTSKAKQLLIDSIKRNFPLPNFFIYKKKSNSFDMVDGQQRTRSILGYYHHNFPDSNGNYFNEDLFNNFLEYEITVISIIDLEIGEEIEEFYSRVNSTGMKLNRPELKKAEYFDTRFLNLLNELATDNQFGNLELFNDNALNRMNDIDFVSELVALLKFSETDKKDYVDTLFEKDITEENYNELKHNFDSVIKTINKLNDLFPIKKTRYKQRNDFYTLFSFIFKNLSLEFEYFKYFYGILILIDNDISPSNDNCQALKEYARNCVTQSNSKKAREARLLFFNKLLLNQNNEPNEVQTEIMDFYKFDNKELTQMGKFFTLNVNKLQIIVEEPILGF